VLFCDHRIEAVNPRLLDIAPTVLDLFGIAKQDYMDGQVLAVADARQPNPQPPSLGGEGAILPLPSQGRGLGG